MRRAGGPPLRDVTARLLFDGASFPGGGSMTRASSVRPPAAGSPFLLPRTRTTPINNVRIATMRTISARRQLGATVFMLLRELVTAVVRAQSLDCRVAYAAG